MKKRKEKRTNRGQRRPSRKAAINSNKITILCISTVVCMLCGVLLYNGQHLEQRIAENNEKIAILQEQIEDENARTKEIEDLEEEMQTDAYIASVARSKLGLANENEIIFKSKN